MPTFSVLTFVGPGPVEARRLGELLDSIACYEPDVAHVVIIDDSSGIDFSALAPPQFTGRVVVLPNPRSKQGDWWQGGLCVALATGLKWIAANTHSEFVVRLDTDALVIAPFAQNVAGRFSARPEVGLLGTWNYWARKGGQRLPHADQIRHLTPILRKAQLPLTLWRHSKWPTRAQCILRRSDRVIYRMIRRAIRNRYRIGDFIQGGGYALSTEMLRRATEEGYFYQPLDYLWQFFSEDVLATLICFAVGLDVGDCNQKGDVFGVAYTHLPGTPEELYKEGYSIIHSIKQGPVTEEEVVGYFRNVRAAYRASQLSREKL